MSDKPVVLIDTHGRNAPAAATFNQGARSIREIEQAADARRAQSRDPARTRDQAERR